MLQIMMDAGAQRWLIKTAYKHYWRVRSPAYQYTDLLQDGWLCYMIVRRRYPEAKDPPHIMRLFQVTFLNEIHDMAKKRSRMDAIIDASADLDTFEQYIDPRDAEQGDGYFIPNSAPWYVHAFLRLLCSPNGPQRLRSRYRIRLSGIRELTHDRLCRLIQADPATTPTLPDALEKYFASV
jgi:hypothetical protein